MTLNVQIVHRWLTHIPAVAYGSRSQSCQWLSPVKQTKSTKVYFFSVTACDKTPALPPNLIIQWTKVGWIGATYIGDEVKAFWLAETQNLKR